MKTIIAMLAFLILCCGAGIANAQATRTWVSGVGDDVNPCSRTAPCKTFAGAISKTAAAGEINCLDSGGFGAVTITKSIAIVCHGVIGGILAANTNGVIVNAAATDEVYLDGLDIQGAGNGLNGVRMIGGGKLTIRNTTITNFVAGTGFCVDVQAANNGRVYVQNSFLANCITGLNIKGAAAGVNNVFVVGTSIDSNVTSGIMIDGPSAVFLIDATIAGNITGITILNGAIVGSYVNNVIRNGGTPTQNFALQ